MFESLYGDNPKIEVQSKYENESIIIQNYGNSMNPFSRFSECTSKYLLLKKLTKININKDKRINELTSNFEKKL